MLKVQFAVGAALVALALLQAATSGELSAQEMTSTSGWEQTSLADPVQRLFAPAGGALLASTHENLVRSDDGGTSWRQIDLPPGSTFLDVDPTDARIQYAGGPAGIYRTEDDGATWRLILEHGAGVGYEVSRLAVSAADHELLYAGIRDAPGVSPTGHLLRSRDRGQTWQSLHTEQATLCSWTTLLLQPDVLDASRVFRATACLAGRTFGAPLEASSDAGTTWLSIFNTDNSRGSLMGYPLALGMAHDTMPQRYYLAANRDARLGGSAVYRTDDNGATWTEVLTSRGGGTPGYRQADDDPDAPNVRLGGLVVDPRDADRVYVGQLVYTQYPPQDPVAGGVLVTADGGTSWAQVSQDLGGVNDLVFAADGKMLYAATDHGVSRLATTDV